MANDRKRGVGIFSEQQSAETALTQLKDSGFPMDKVSLIARQVEQEGKLADAQVTSHIGEQNVKGTTGIVADTFASSVIATVLVGLTALVLPSIGPIIAAGTAVAGFAATVASTGIEAASAGNLVKALVDLGVPEKEASFYSDRLIQGDYFILIDGSDENIDQATAILSEQGIQNWQVYTFA